MPGGTDAKRRAAFVSAVAFAAVAVVAGPASASPAAGPASARTLLGTLASPRYKPRTLHLTQAGHAYVITAIRWRRWNSNEAIGVGNGTASTACLPGCPASYSFTARATLVASDRAYCGAMGAYLYDELNVSLRGRRRHR